MFISCEVALKCHANRQNTEQEQKIEELLMERTAECVELKKKVEELSNTNADEATEPEINEEEKRGNELEITQDDSYIIPSISIPKTNTYELKFILLKW